MRCLDRSRAAVVLGLAALILSPPVRGQEKPVNGIRPADLRAHAIVGATVVVRPGVTVENATIVIRDGTIEAVGTDIDIPADARRWPADGLTVYAGLIDAAVFVDAAAPTAGAGRHWNGAIHPETSMAEQPLPPASVRKSLRELGFTAAAFYPSKGIFRGSGAVLALADDAVHVRTYRKRAAMAMGFDRGGGGSSRSTPSSLMGVIALVRQTLLDARWHADGLAVYRAHPDGNEPPPAADALVALRSVLAREQPVLFETGDELNLLRAARLADEYDLDAIMLGSGMEFRRLKEITATRRPIIVPLEYPDRPDVSSVSLADRTTLRTMMTWEQAPTNARRLVDAGVTVALTTHGLETRKDFPGAVRKAIRHGLSEDDALAALTTTPARLLGLDHVLGTIEPGKLANLVVVDGHLFEKDAKVRATWINGRRSEIDDQPEATLVLHGTLTTSDGLALAIDLDTTKPSVSFELPDDKRATAKKITVLRERISIVVDGRPFGAEGYVQLSGAMTAGGVAGRGVRPGGRRFDFSIAPSESGPEDTGEADEGDEHAAGPDEVSGTWTLTALAPWQDESRPFDLDLERDADGTITGRALHAGKKLEVSRGTYDTDTARLELEFVPAPGAYTIEATIAEGRLTGTFTAPEGRGELAGERTATARADDDESFEMPPEELVSPLGAYGLAAMPRPRAVLIEHATIWTGGPAGIIEDGSLLVADGRIRAVGVAVRLPDGLGDVERIDGKGKHVTAGLIDCHSHTGVSGGVNEYPEANTAEVRIGDVVNPDDINWYRELAGGLTAANQLHGSANPIGGQNNVVKLRWGGGPDDFRIRDAAPGIKFALGENVKRRPNRYPNTRMGVETFIRDAFTAARAYEAGWERYRALSEAERARTMPPRRDLELTTLVEILNGDRLVHCHSYRQDEILMLVRVAESFGFTIGTFQHVLEGYKVADAIAAHGAGASTFSDWWAYKVEVMDAVPYNGSLMTEIGVLVSFNSDSSELARRLNTEAAKAVRYGGLDPHEALKLVTLNPARQLHIDHRTGSLEVGKDADFVIWSESPLSTFAVCEQTWIEGARFFDRAADARMRERVKEERHRLIQKILAYAHGDPPGPSAASDDDDSTGRPTGAFAHLSERARAWMEEEVRLGRDPVAGGPGECGCGGLWHMMESE